jgi:hypothetical protein
MITLQEALAAKLYYEIAGKPFSGIPILIHLGSEWDQCSEEIKEEFLKMAKEVIFDESN